MSDTIALSSKGIAAGFGIEELETIFTFVKRRTEATGEDFEAMADRMITALQKGRFTTLADMGLIIDKGETVSTMLAKSRMQRNSTEKPALMSPTKSVHCRSSGSGLK